MTAPAQVAGRIARGHVECSVVIGDAVARMSADYVEVHGWYAARVTTPEGRELRTTAPTMAEAVKWACVRLNQEDPASDGAPAKGGKGK